MNGGEGLPATTNPLIGQVVHERYRIDRLIGRGGMGVVYEAQHLLIGRKVALKALTANAALSPDRAERFRREAHAAAGLGSSHIVDVLDMGQLESGVLFIVMEHLEGSDLGFAVGVAEQLPVPRAVHILCQLCDALSAVHAAGIVHRDLKPENVFLISRDGQPDFVKVLDFGICKFIGDAEPHLTETGDTLGTPLFMAPEQVEGRRDVDHRADIYALGALLFFMLTGRAPFDAKSLPLLFIQICQEAPPSLRAAGLGLPHGLDATIQRALSKRPEDRFQSCAELKAALVPFVHHLEALHDTLPELSPRAHSLSPPPATPDTLLRPYLPQRRLAKLGVVAFGLLAGGIFAMRRLTPTSDVAASPTAPRPVASVPAQLPPETPTLLAAQSDEPALPALSALAPGARPSPTPRVSTTEPHPSRPASKLPAAPEAAPLPEPAPATPTEPRAPAAAAALAPPSPTFEVPLNREPKRGL